MTRLVAARLVGTASWAAHPRDVNCAVFADSETSEILVSRIFLYWIDCGLDPIRASIGGMRDQHLVLISLMRPYDPGDIEAVHPGTARISVHLHRCLKGKRVSRITQGDGWLAPVSPVDRSL